MILSKELNSNITLTQRTAFFKGQPWAEAIMRGAQLNKGFEDAVLLSAHSANIGTNNKHLTGLVADRLIKLSIQDIMDIDALNLSNKELFKKVMTQGVERGWYDMPEDHIAPMVDLVADPPYPYFLVEDLIASGYAYRVHDGIIELPEFTLIRICHGLAYLKDPDGSIADVVDRVHKYKNGVLNTGARLIDTDILRHMGKALIPA